MPIWEGFDEAFHYGYVETLWQTRPLLVLGRTLLPADVWRSFVRVPVSAVTHRWYEQTITFTTWFSLRHQTRPSGEMNWTDFARRRRRVPYPITKRIIHLSRICSSPRSTA